MSSDSRPSPASRAPRVPDPPNIGTVSQSSRRRHKSHQSESTGRRSPPLRSGSDYDSDRVRADFGLVQTDGEYRTRELPRRLESERRAFERRELERREFERRELERREFERMELERRERESFLVAHTEHLRKEQEKLQRARIIAEREERAEQDRRARFQERHLIEQNERSRREQDRFAKEQELIRLEQEIRQLTQKEYMDRMERDQELPRFPRKDKRTNSGKPILEPRQRALERTSSSTSSALPVPPEEEPKSFFSRWFPSGSSTRVDTTPKAEVIPKAESGPKPEAPAKVEKSQQQPKPAPTSSLDLEGYFLQPAEDSHIQKGVVALSDSIDQHVYNHYGNRSTGPAFNAFLKIVRIDGKDLNIPKTLISKQSIRLALIRKSIASEILWRIATDGDPNSTFLPKDIVSLLSMVPAHSTEKFRFAASSVFRRTAANLLRLNQSGESPEYAEFKCMQVRAASELLHKQLSTLANPDSSESARREQLEAIMMKAAEIGVLLLLQPSSHRCEWSVQLSTGSSLDDQGKGETRPGTLVVFPALIRTGDSTGRKLRRPQMVCKPEYLDEDDIAESSNK